MKRASILIAITCVALLAARPASRPTAVEAGRLGEDVVIVGRLGVPVGQEVTIAGHKRGAGPVPGLFAVDTVDGRPAPAGTRVDVPAAARWPNGTAATLRGCEVGTLKYLQLSNTNFFGDDDPRWTGPHQTLFLHFDISEVVEPKGLK